MDGQAPASPPTRVRHRVVFLGMTLAVLTYLDRVCIAQTQTEIAGALALSKTQMGWVFSAFTLAYALFEVPTGWWGDRIGPRRVLTRVVLWWSAFTALTGAAWSFASLLVFRFLFGAGEAGAFPSLAKAFRLWLPAHERAPAQGLLWAAARLGGATAPALVMAVMQVMSWRWVFVAFAALGPLWVLWFRRVFGDDPRRHPRANAAERALEPLADSVDGGAPAPWRRLLTSPSVRQLCLQYACQGFFFYFMVSWLPTYLREARRLDVGGAALLSGLPLLMGALGCLLGGHLLRHLDGILGARRARRALALFSFATAPVLLLLVPVVEDGVVAVLLIGAAAFCNDLAMATIWMTCTDLGGRYAGTLGGAMNMWGSLGGFVSPIFIGYIVDRTGAWTLPFRVAAGVYVVGLLVWLRLDPVRPVLEEG